MGLLGWAPESPAGLVLPLILNSSVCSPLKQGEDDEWSVKSKNTPLCSFLRAEVSAVRGIGDVYCSTPQKGKHQSFDK